MKEEVGPPYRHYVLVHPVAGVYLGNYLDRDEWSRVSTPYRDRDAVTYPTRVLAEAVARLFSGDVVAHEVVAWARGYATVKECVEAGLEPWEVENDSVLD